jgi:hypothetical protein
MSREELIHRIAALLDHPSVFMGGPSKQNLRKAAAIVEMLADEKILTLTSK